MIFIPALNYSGISEISGGGFPPPHPDLSVSFGGPTRPIRSIGTIREGRAGNTEKLTRRRGATLNLDPAAVTVTNVVHLTSTHILSAYRYQSRDIRQESLGRDLIYSGNSFSPCLIRYGGSVKSFYYGIK